MATCHLLPAPEWPALAAFIHRHNRRPDGRARCLHAEQGESAADHAAELAALSPTEAIFVVADGASPATDRWAGMIGAEIDTNAGRAWLRGPLTADLPPAVARELHRPLIAALLRALPAVQRFDAFPSADEAPLLDAYRGAGFEDLQRHHVLRLAQPSPQRAEAAGAPVLALQRGDPAIAAVLSLHDRLFPQTYLPGAALASSLDDAHRLFVAPYAEGIGGYVYVKHQRLENDGYVDYLGVHESARGHGLGRALLDAAVQWALVQRRLPLVHLTVRQDRAQALGLYRAAGFHEVAAGRQMSLQRAGSAAPR